MAKDGQKEKKIRHLDHLPDMQEGEKFTMVPRCLAMAWLNKDSRMPDAKFRLLFCLMSHGTGFKVKRAYLTKRFHPNTVDKYMKELEAEGYIRVEKAKRPDGGYENWHHVNSISEWDIKRNPTLEIPEQPETEPLEQQPEPPEQPKESDSSPVNLRQVDDDSPVNCSSVNCSSVNPLNETNANQTKGNETKKKSSAALSAGGKVPSKKRLVGMFSMLYGQYAKRTVMETLVDDLEEAFGKNRRPVIQGILREYLDKEKREDLEWQSNHYSTWKRAVSERLQTTVH